MPELPPLAPLLQARATLDSFDVWYEAHFDYVWRSLKRLGVAQADLGDLTHDVFVVAWRQRDVIDPTRPLRPWLFGVCFRTASAHRRRSWFKFGKHAVANEPADWRPSPEHAALVRAELEALNLALAEVPIKQRAVLLLHDFDEAPATEVASALGIPLKTVYSRLDAGRKRFRQCYRQQELLQTARQRLTTSTGECS